MTPEELKRAKFSPGDHALLQVQLIHQLVEMLSNINAHLSDIHRQLRDIATNTEKK